MGNKYQHLNCGWIGNGSEILKAPNPFQKKELLFQCPGCKGLNGLYIINNEKKQKSVSNEKRTNRT